jgi:hypothetical protein
MYNTTESSASEDSFTLGAAASHILLGACQIAGQTEPNQQVALFSDEIYYQF